VHVLCSALDREVMKNPLATFFFLLTAMVQDHQGLQDSLLRDDTIPIIGYLLQKVCNVLMIRSLSAVHSLVANDTVYWVICHDFLFSLGHCCTPLFVKPFELGFIYTFRVLV
jgi:hypothetical protein